MEKDILEQLMELADGDGVLIFRCEMETDTYIVKVEVEHKLKEE